MQSTVFFYKEDSKSKEKETTLLEKIENIDVVCLCIFNLELRNFVTIALGVQRIHGRTKRKFKCGK